MDSILKEEEVKIYSYIKKFHHGLIPCFNCKIDKCYYYNDIINFERVLYEYQEFIIIFV